MISYTAAFYPTWDEALVTRLIGPSGLDLKQRVSSLSTGQAQRLAIILALGHQPEVLILDEPAASLDPQARREVLSSLLEVAQNENRTILFSTHIMSDLERVASHVALLRDGQVDVFEELDGLKDRVKRLRVSANHNLPSDLTVPGAIRTQVDGPFATVAVNQSTPAIVADLEQRWQASIEVEDLNLEEIYLELNHR
jgi:ABC-2 type transport system ATP-binding protein